MTTFKWMFTLADPVDRTVRKYSDYSLTILLPRITMAKISKKNIHSIAIMIPRSNLNYQMLEQ